MRGDYYKPGPPWKAIFRDKKGFISQDILREKNPPEEYYIMELDEFEKPKRHTFVKCGELGNIVIYKEK